MAQIVKRYPDCPMGKPQGVPTYDYLFKSIIFQQLSGKAAQSIYNSVVSFFGGKLPLPEELLDISPDILRSLGVARMKALFLKSLSEYCLAKELPSHSQLLKMSEEEIRERLLKIKGVGNWTVDMLLMFNLGLPDIFPASDLGIQKGHALLTGKERLSPTELAKEAQVWSPYRSYAAWYLWRLADSGGMDDLWRDKP